MGQTPGKIFVSSTVYDLLDVRAEVHEHLRDLGLSPSLSDEQLSDFEVSGHGDSIATCLSNVETSVAFVCILSQRYGPSLQKNGYPDVSATHIEYKTALKAGLPIYFFVRDRLEGDLQYWKDNKHLWTGNKDTDPKHRWAQAESIERLSHLVESHRTLVAGSPETNWYDTFKSSVELKRTLSVRLSRFSRGAKLRKAQEEGRLPQFSFSSPSQTNIGGNNIATAKTELRNFGTTAALEMEIELIADIRTTVASNLALGVQEKTVVMLAFPVKSTMAGARRLYHTPPLELIVTYRSIYGYRVADTYRSNESTSNGVSNFQLRFVSSEILD